MESLSWSAWTTKVGSFSSHAGWSRLDRAEGIIAGPLDRPRRLLGGATRPGSTVRKVASRNTHLHHDIVEDFVESIRNDNPGRFNDPDSSELEDVTAIHSAQPDP